MYFLLYHVVPAAKHPDRARLGDCFACCWIVRRSLAEADRVARRTLGKAAWRIVERDTGKIIRRSDYEASDDNLAHFEQARIDREVYVIHESPRYPVYWVTAAVRDKKTRERASAHYFLCNEAVAQTGDNVFSTRFWTGKRVRTALEWARAAIDDAGWEVASIVKKRPCGLRDVPPEFTRYYDETEERGACLVFVHDG